jgi:hypothetical protein
VSCFSWERSEDRATVSSFALDRHEATVGRFRAFVEAYDGSPPTSGAGAHPLIAGSGWDSGWNTQLPADQAALIANAKYEAAWQTWPDNVGANEANAVGLPIPDLIGQLPGAARVQCSVQERRVRPLGERRLDLTRRQRSVVDTKLQVDPVEGPNRVIRELRAAKPVVDVIDVG